MLRIFYFQRSRCDIRIDYRPFTDPVRVLRTAYLIEFISANKKPFRIAFGFVFCGYENFIVHNCEMKKSFNFDKVSFLSEQPEKSTDFLSSFLETQVGFQSDRSFASKVVHFQLQKRPLLKTIKVICIIYRR